MRLAQVSITNRLQAVRQLQQALSGEPPALIVFFCASPHAQPDLAQAMVQAFPGVPLLGCSAAAEIGPAGCLEGSLTAAALSANDFSAALATIGSLSDFDQAQARSLVEQLQQTLAAKAPWAQPADLFALLLIDGQSMQEERVARALQVALGPVPLVGGSASRVSAGVASAVLSDGAFHSGIARVALVASRRAFQTFMTQHFEARPARLVVTEADPARRVIRELDGQPAAEVYAAQIGVPVGALADTHFALTPFAVNVLGVPHVRSIRHVLPDGSLQLYCTIERGVVLRPMRDGHLLDALTRSLAQLRAQLGDGLQVLGFDCVLRRVECERRGFLAAAGAAFAAHGVVGFNGFGEQFRGMHVNQTFTGVAFGARR